MKFDRPVGTAEERIEAIAAYLPLLREIKDAELQGRIAEVYVRILEDCKWESVEAACFNPDFQQQKLINHIRVTTEATYTAAELMNKYQGLELDTDIVLGLGLLHDVSKFLEFEPDEAHGARVSSLGKNIQHGVTGAYGRRGTWRKQFKKSRHGWNGS